MKLDLLTRAVEGLLVALWLGGGHLIWRSTVSSLQPLVTEVLGVEGKAPAAEPKGGQVQ